MIFKSEIIFVKLIIPLILGIITAYFFQTETTLYYTQNILLAILTTISLMILLYKRLKIWLYKKTVASILYLLFFLLGAWLCLVNTNFLKRDYFARNNYPQLKVWVANEPQQKEDILRFEVNIEKGYLNNKAHKASGKLLVALKLDSLKPIKLQYGDELLMIGNYNAVEPPYNPYEFDFKKWLAAKNIYQQTFIRQDQLIQTKENVGNPIIRYALQLRKRQIDTYRQLIKDDEAFAVASTLVLGYRADLSKETLAAYSKTGTIHALSVSGMHVGLVYLMLHAMLFFLNRKKATIIIKIIFIILAIWAYSLITGFAPSVLRSAIMLSIYILSKQFKKSNNSYNILAFAAFTLLIYNPFFIWDVGFQLSFISVFGLIYLQPKIYEWLHFKNKIADQIWNVTALSLSAQLVTMPLSVYYFHQFPMYFIISNLFILIPVSLMMYLGLGILVLKVYFLAPIFEWIIIINNSGLKWISTLPYASLSQIWLNPWQLLLLCLLVIFLIVGLIYYQKKTIYLSLIILFIFQMSINYQKINRLYEKDILLFSLRKNYAAAFIEGKRAIIMTDLKTNNKNYEFFIKPAIDRKNIKTIKFISWQDDYNAGNFTKNNHQIHFNNISFLLLDSSFNHKKLEGRPYFYTIWKHQNPKFSIENLKNEVSFKELILDATNKDYYLAKSLRQADSLNISITILKKQKSHTLNID